MLVAHDAVETHLVGKGILLVVLVVENVGLLRVEVGVGEAQTPGIVLLQVLAGDVAVGLFREPVNLRLVRGALQLIDHGCLLAPRLLRLG